MSMARRLLKESLIICGGTLFFLVLCATVGISTSTPPTTPTAEAAYAHEYAPEDRRFERYPAGKLEDEITTLPAD
jgi:hypothetical protein